MDRFSKFLCDPIKLIKSVIMLCVGIGVVVYVWLQATGGFGNGIETESAMLVKLNDSVESKAFIFRDETVIDLHSGGTIVTVVSDSDRVSKGQLVANVYDTENDALLQDEINRVQRKIDILEESEPEAGYVITDISRLDKEIDALYCDIAQNATNGELGMAISNSSELLIKLNKKDLAVESDYDYQDEKKQLLDRKRSIEGRIDAISQPLYAPTSGYFYGNVDGYEEDFQISLLDDLTIKEFSELSQLPKDEVNNTSSVKIVNDFVWYLACSIDVEKMAGVKAGNTYTVEFPENGDMQIEMTLQRIISETTSPISVAVFRANVLPEGFSFKRVQRANIVLNSKSGLSVPKKALRVENGVSGVYILIGDVVRFRSVDIIDEKDNYYIVSYKKDNQLFEEQGDELIPNVSPLALYDSVIVSGKNLFDGKIVD